MGDVVNTASRLQTAAPPGGVLVGPATHAATDGAIALRVRRRGRGPGPRGEGGGLAGHRADHAAGPAPPARRRCPSSAGSWSTRCSVDTVRHRPLPASSRAGRDRGRRRGRQDPTGRGGPDRPRQAVRAARCSSGSCVPYGEANRWWPIASALAPVLDVDLGSSPARDAPVNAGAPAGDADRPAGRPGAPRRPGQRPAPPVRAAVTRSTASTRPARTRSSSGPCWPCWPRWPGERPLTMVVADLHWASLRVLELLEAALARLASTPFALIATTRPGGDLPGAAPVGPPDHPDAALGAARPGSATELLRRDARRRDQPWRSPRSCTTAAVATRSSWRSWPSWWPGGGQTDQLPDSLRALVAARLDELPADQRAMLDNAAVLGSSGSYGGLVEFGQALGQNTARSLARRAGRRRAARGRGRVVALPLGQRPRGRLPHDHQGGSGPPPRRRGQGHDRGRALRLARPTSSPTTGPRRPSSPGELGGGRLPGVPRDVVQQAVRALLASATNDVDRLYPRPAIGQVARALSIGDCDLDGSTRRSLVPDAGRGLGRAAAVPRGRGRPPRGGGGGRGGGRPELRGAGPVRPRRDRPFDRALPGRARPSSVPRPTILEQLGDRHELAGRAAGLGHELDLRRPVRGRRGPPRPRGGAVRRRGRSPGPRLGGPAPGLGLVRAGRRGRGRRPARPRPRPR